MRLLLLGLYLFVGISLYAQKPANGTYTYSLAFAEWNGKSNGATCTVKVKGDSVIVIHNGTKGLSGQRGDVLDRGILMKHKSGKWIIGHGAKDKNAKEIGGCCEGPRVIDVKKKKYWTC